MTREEQLAKKREYRKRLYMDRKLAGLCIDCAARLGDEDGLRCIDCAERSRVDKARYFASQKGRKKRREGKRRAYWRDPIAARVRLADARQRRKEAGICVSCTEPALDDHVCCAKHRDALNEANRRYRDRLKGLDVPKLKPKHTRRARPARPRDEIAAYVPFDAEPDHRTRVLMAMRWLDWASGHDVLTNAGYVYSDDSKDWNAANQMLVRLVKSGLVERIGWRGVYEYRLTATGKAEADKIRTAGLRRAA